MGQKKKRKKERNTIYMPLHQRCVQDNPGCVYLEGRNLLHCCHRSEAIMRTGQLAGSFAPPALTPASKILHFIIPARDKPTLPGSLEVMGLEYCFCYRDC